MRRRPERFGFGGRHLHRGLPVERQRALTQRAYVASIEDFAERLPHAGRLMARLADEIAGRASIVARAALD